MQGIIFFLACSYFQHLKYFIWWSSGFYSGRKVWGGNSDFSAFRCMLVFLMLFLGLFLCLVFLTFWLWYITRVLSLVVSIWSSVHHLCLNVHLFYWAWEVICYNLIKLSALFDFVSGPTPWILRFGFLNISKISWKFYSCFLILFPSICLSVLLSWFYLLTHKFVLLHDLVYWWWCLLFDWPLPHFKDSYSVFQSLCWVVPVFWAFASGLQRLIQFGDCLVKVLNRFP